MRRDTWVPVAAVVIMALTLALLPPERHLGRLLVPIYVHGALVRSGVILFLAGALAAIAALVTDDPGVWRWTRALQVTSLSAWAAGFILSFYPSYATWGTIIAWSEPRTQMVIRVLVVTLVVFGAARWLDDARAIAAASILMGVAVPILILRTGVIRHPVDPIGTSPSVWFRVAYLIVLLCMLVLCMWGTYRLAEQRG